VTESSHRVLRGDDAEDSQGAERSASEELERLGELVATLRARCPWDRRQTHLSLAPHLLEESYEAIEAIQAVAKEEPQVSQNAVLHLEEELGDVLFQVYFHSQLAAEEGRFTLADVARAVHDKLVGRHPHVFGDASAHSADEVAARWEVLKRSEKRQRGVTDAIPDAMPALALVTKLLKKAGSLGVALPSSSARKEEVVRAMDHLVERSGRQASDAPRSGQDDTAGGEEESARATEPDFEMIEAVGEALLALADLARRVGVDPELALRTQATGLRQEVETAHGEH
jgi:tetrapyrrole methylase family protein / MazG family protein